MVTNIMYDVSHVIANSSVQVATSRVAASWPWYVVRGAGFLAFGLLILLMLSGIGQVTGLTYRFFEPTKAWFIHRTLGIALCFAIVIHVSFLLIDHYVRFNLIQLLVPFAATYKRSKLLGISVGSLSVALGVFAMYFTGIIVASSLGWINSKKRAWKMLHYLSYLVIIFVFFHALYTGTDLVYGVFRSVWILMGAVLLLAIASRVWRTGVIGKTKR